ncbi:MAG: hypothetical protein COV30_01090 [Candidatus Yanofskybacteria bacterium CG10_big_fil_rev_8_21_14_0_10_37_15]|uniref:3D domain-containing protein n=1 Tax=Candidatus Yanofskybacteria bacterium CG10_big_fil_rev_8_21_14_0_10_37_15 TaxID=1975097 RepID=A0A2H0R608_9BACT|nr:MAG: hypothetical protein COV30_01090 [Candidatus Yanofskybacteria bacterium CG10_big_fil_rev_8_21_14_0_10_37_15]
MYKKLILAGVLLTIFLLPHNPAHANTYANATSKAFDHIIGFHKSSDDLDEEKESFKPQEIKIEIKKKIQVTVTAYSSTPWQTDDTPCITSTGFDVCNKTKNVIAVSRDLVRSLGYHKQVLLPDLFGSTVFHIEDTMNARFTNRIDVHFDSTNEAKEFGLKRNVELQVL